MILKAYLYFVSETSSVQWHLKKNDFFFSNAIALMKSLTKYRLLISFVFSWIFLFFLT